VRRLARSGYGSDVANAAYGLSGTRVRPAHSRGPDPAACDRGRIGSHFSIERRCVEGFDKVVAFAGQNAGLGDLGGLIGVEVAFDPRR